MVRRLLLACAALALSACATQMAGTPATETANAVAAPAERDCFLNSQINGYNYIDQNHVRITIGANRHYILATNWNARDLNWGETIAIRSATDWVCTGNGLGVEVIGGRPHRHFPIQSIERQPEPPPLPQPQGS